MDAGGKCCARGLLATPLVFGTEPPLYFSDHVAGCLVIMVPVTAIAEVVRPARFLNVVIGAWIAVAPFLLDGETTAAAIADLLIGLGLIRAQPAAWHAQQEHYGGWDQAII